MPNSRTAVNSSIAVMSSLARPRRPTLRGLTARNTKRSANREYQELQAALAEGMPMWIAEVLTLGICGVLASLWPAIALIGSLGGFIALPGAYEKARNQARYYCLEQNRSTGQHASERLAQQAGFPLFLRNWCPLLTVART